MLAESTILLPRCTFTKRSLTTHRDLNAVNHEVADFAVRRRQARPRRRQLAHDDLTRYHEHTLTRRCSGISVITNIYANTIAGRMGHGVAVAIPRIPPCRRPFQTLRTEVQTIDWHQVQRLAN